MKNLNKLSTQISVSLFIIVLLSFYWWQTTFSSKKIKINLSESNIVPALNIEEAEYTGYSKDGQKFSISAKLSISSAWINLIVLIFHFNEFL